MINESLGWSGLFCIKKINKKTGEVTEKQFKNQITSVALDAMINVLDNIDPNLDIKWLAVGTGTGALDPTDTTLGTEIFRTDVDTSNNDATGQFTTTFTILDTDSGADATWAELGVFCGDSATSSSDTGIMLTRILIDETKTSSEEFQFTRQDNIARN